MCRHSTIVLYVLFILSCTTCLFQFVCSLFVLIFAPTQILRALAAPTQLVPVTASHRPPLLKSQCWRFCSNANAGAPIPTPANIFPSIPFPSYQRPIQSICPIQPVANQPDHKIHFLIVNSRPIPIRSSQYYLAYKIHPIQSI